MKPHSRTATLLGMAAAVIVGAPGCHSAAMESTEAAGGWQSLFDGTSLEGWRASDAPGTFRVKEGAIVAHGPRSHLFYVGPVGAHDLRNFELQLEVMTFPNANSGVYFHTQWQEKGWPDRGYEVQVNNSHTDTSRTGGLWGVRDVRQVKVADRHWFKMAIRVEGKRILTRIGEETIVDYTEEPNPQRLPALAQRLLGSGTIALQGHDPGSEVHYRNIRIRALP